MQHDNGHEQDEQGIIKVTIIVVFFIHKNLDVLLYHNVSYYSECNFQASHKLGTGNGE